MRGQYFHDTRNHKWGPAHAPFKPAERYLPEQISKLSSIGRTDHPERNNTYYKTHQLRTLPSSVTTINARVSKQDY